MNGEVFTSPTAIEKMSDGSSNTVMVAEGYAQCYGGGTGYRYAQWNPSYPDYGYTYSYAYEYTNGTKYNYNYGYNYSYSPRFGKVAGKTFQVRPSTSTCDGTLPQGLSAGSMQILLADGSVRGVTDGMTSSTWGAALTPSSGDIMGSDWGN